jgi:hypothetical protein
MFGRGASHRNIGWLYRVLDERIDFLQARYHD